METEATTPGGVLPLMLSQGKFKSLKQLKIFLDLESMSAPTYGQDLYTGKLRSQP